MKSTRYLRGQQGIFEVNKIFTRSTRYLRGQRGICEVNEVFARYVRCQQDIYDVKQGEKNEILAETNNQNLIKLNTSKFKYSLP